MERSLIDPARRLWAACWMTLILTLATRDAVALAAAPAQVRFDVVRVIACRDVTTPEFAAVNPQAKLVRAVFELSALVQGDEGSLIENRYQITIPHHRLQVADYEPRTTAASQYAGNIGVERHRESSKNAAFSLSGGWKHLASITGSGDAAAKDTSIVRYELLPPLESVAASGTLQRGAAVYFKLKRVRQSLLEGAKQFAITFRAPRTWRADYVHVRCAATGVRETAVFSAPEEVSCGEANFLVALYLEGDEESQRVATRFMDAAIALGNLAAQSRREIHRRNYPTVFHEFGALIGAVEPKISESWLSDIMYQPPENGWRQVTRELPSDVRQAAQQYLAARDALRRLDLDGAPPDTR